MRTGSRYEITCGHPDRKNRSKGKCESCYLAHRRNSIPRIKEQNAEWNLLRKYGITLAQRNALFESQSRRCALCLTADFGKGYPHVDHCHTTGKVRGILCTKCNIGLGAFRDNKVLLLAAVSYLEGSAS